MASSTGSSVSSNETSLSVLYNTVQQKTELELELFWTVEINVDGKQAVGKKSKYDQAKEAACKDALNLLDSLSDGNVVSVFVECIQKRQLKPTFFVQVECKSSKGTLSSDVFPSTTLSSKETQQKAASSLLEKLKNMNISVSTQTTTTAATTKKTIGTPLSRLNELQQTKDLVDVQQISVPLNSHGEQEYQVSISAKVRINRSFLKDHVVVDKTTERVELCSKSRQGPHKNYLLQKAALNVLCLASCYNDTVWSVFSGLDQAGTLRFGDKFDGEEGEDLEFKGGDSATDVLPFKNAKKHVDKHLGKTACAFLNSKGGRFLVGVHDKGQIQGVVFSDDNKDEMKRSIVTTLQRIEPSCLDHFNVRFRSVTGSMQLKAGEELYVVEVLIPTQAKSESRATYLYNKQQFIRVLSCTTKVTMQVTPVDESSDEK